MSFTEFIVQILHYAAWPAMIFGVVLLFRERIEVLLKSRMKVRHKDTEVELNIPADIQKEMSRKMKLEDVNEGTLTWGNYVDALESWAYNLCIRISLFWGCFPLEVKKDVEAYHDDMRRMQTLLTKISKERPTSKVIKLAQYLIGSKVDEWLKKPSE